MERKHIQTIVGLILISTVVLLFYNGSANSRKNQSQSNKESKKNNILGGPIVFADVSINGIRANGILDKTQLKKLGEPLKIEEQNVEEGWFKWYIFKDLELETQYDENEKQWYMCWFHITGKKFCTKRGISIGDDVSEVLRKYGDKEVTDNVLIYDNDDGMTVQFDFKKKKVTTIGLH